MYSSVLKGWLNVYVTINILYIIYLWGHFLIIGHQTSYESLETSICTIMCIMNIVGIVYISRNFRFGVYILFSMPIFMFILSLAMIGEMPLSIYAYLLFAIITLVLLFMKSNNRTVWSQMNEGIDFIHFKHIYQLSTALILIVAGYGAHSYFVSEDSPKDDMFKISSEPLSESDKEKLLKELDKPTITLGQISKVEKAITKLPLEYEVRIMAMRHILAGHIVPNTHDVEAFKMAYSLRKDALSFEQQEVLDWFFRQNREVHEIWSVSDGSNSISAFQENLKCIMKKRKITEL